MGPPSPPTNAAPVTAHAHTCRPARRQELQVRPAGGLAANWGWGSLQPLRTPCQQAAGACMERLQAAAAASTTHNANDACSPALMPPPAAIAASWMFGLRQEGLTAPGGWRSALGCSLAPAAA
jgi:hypothetical protein